MREVKMWRGAPDVELVRLPLTGLGSSCRIIACRRSGSEDVR